MSAPRRAVDQDAGNADADSDESSQGEGDFYDAGDDNLDGSLENNVPPPAPAVNQQQRQLEEHEEMATEFEDIDLPDGPEVLKTLASCSVKWDKDVEWFFLDLEMRMELLSITSQWYKRIVLVNNLPEHANQN